MPIAINTKLGGLKPPRETTEELFGGIAKLAVTQETQDADRTDSTHHKDADRTDSTHHKDADRTSADHHRDTDRNHGTYRLITKKAGAVLLAGAIVVGSVMIYNHSVNAFTEPNAITRVEVAQPRQIDVIMARDPDTGALTVVNQDLVAQELAAVGVTLITNSGAPTATTNANTLSLDTLLKNISDNNDDQTIQADLNLPNGVDFNYIFPDGEQSPK